MDYSPSENQSIEIRNMICDQLEATRIEFMSLVDSISQNEMKLQSGIDRWNLRDLLYHITIAASFLPINILLMRAGLSTPYLGVPLFNWLNNLLCRIGAIGQNSTSIKRKYNKAIFACQQQFKQLTIEDLNNRRLYPGWDPEMRGEVTYYDLFASLIKHFYHHAAQIRSVLDTQK
jgi:hypothetical protein